MDRSIQTDIEPTINHHANILRVPNHHKLLALENFVTRQGFKMLGKNSSLVLRAFFTITCLAYLSTFISTGATHDSAAIEGGTSKGHEQRIVGGAVPPEGKYPSLARISRISEGDVLKHVCAGSILNRDWILSSAFCFTTRKNKFENFSRLIITVGDSILNETEPYEQVLGIQRVIIHEKLLAQKLFNHTQFLYDIALVKVVPSIKFSNRVTAVNLPTCGEFELGTGWIAGWGRSTNPTVTRLTEVSNPLVTNEECDKYVKTLRPYYEITKLITCTRYVDRMGWCVGDNGAPLFMIKNESYMVQVGIASVRVKYDTSCAPDGHMALYTRVSEYLGWIHRRISGCGNHPFHPITEMDEEVY